MNEMDEYRSTPVPRTIKLPGKVWRAVKAKGKRDGKPTREVIEDAVKTEMPALVNSLRDFGIKGELTNNKVIRAPMSDALLDRMRAGRDKTGLPAIQMLALCLQRHTARRRRRGATRA